jgi:hypothetical protein
MRLALLATLLLSGFLVGGCACDHPTAFWWNTRLVPTTGHEQTVSGTGATEAIIVAAPVHEMHH